ncbi:hypothetical protein cypCar_00009119 [Cyprinus carpio]|nr:hypothetical protein cypCar_00009119 [Cyprinus carpio]
MEHTIFLTPLLNGSAKDLLVKLNSSISGVDVSVSVCVFSMLCRYFSVDERRWSSDGLSPLSGSSPHTAHCLTHHLTMFGASLFIHPEALLLLPPSEEPVRNVVVGIVCGVLLLIYLLVGLIAHKLDHLESLRLSWVPLCGQKGHYQYRVLVKTGWKKGSGTTAHVGISLYGLNKSGSRHLQREGAFQRNSLDDFQVETDANLGEIWKIRIWHDNTGLDPSWYLKHVIVWDIQTDNMFFFLVEDWLSVENEKNSGRVEKVILASCKNCRSLRGSYIPSYCLAFESTICGFHYGNGRPTATLDEPRGSPAAPSYYISIWQLGQFGMEQWAERAAGPDSSIYDGPSPFTKKKERKNRFLVEFFLIWNHLLFLEEDLRTITADLDPSNTLSLEPEASDSGHFTPNDTILSDIQDSLCSEWSDLSMDTPTSEPGFHKSSSSLSVLSDASTFLPSLPPDSTSTISNTRIGVVRGVTGFFLPSWVLRMIHLLVAVLLGTSLALVGLYGSRFSSSVVLMWLVSALSAFLTSALLLEPFAICIQALYLAAVVKPVDPEVENRLAQETEVRRTEEDLGDKVHPLCGYGLLQAKEEARKLRTLRALMRSCLVYLLFLLVVLMVNYQEYVHETNSRRLHSAIKQTLITALPGQPSLTALSG